MAAFLVRAFGYSAGGGTNYFVDDNGHVFEGAINRLRAAGVTQGCNPPSNNRFCPDAYVTRGQMAAFLKRAIESGASAAAPSSVLVARAGDGAAVMFSDSRSVAMSSGGAGFLLVCPGHMIPGP